MYSAWVCKSFGLVIKVEKRFIRPRPRKNYFVVDTFKLILKDQLIPDGVHKRSEQPFDGFNVFSKRGKIRTDIISHKLIEVLAPEREKDQIYKPKKRILFFSLVGFIFLGTLTLQHCTGPQMIPEKK